MNLRVGSTLPFQTLFHLKSGCFPISCTSYADLALYDLDVVNLQAILLLCSQGDILQLCTELHELA